MNGSMRLIRDAFCARLDTLGIHYAASKEELTVNGQLALLDTRILDWPEGLTIDGDLLLDGGHMTELPARLVVRGTLSLFGAHVDHLPADVSIGGSLWLDYSWIIDLPDHLCVPGELDLSHTQIRCLPKGLLIGGDLFIGNTSIERLPPDLSVGGEIHPPPGLIDIRNFMDTQNDTHIVIGPFVSHHQRLETIQRLAAFPDLKTVVALLAPGRAIHIHQNGDMYEVSLVSPD